MGNDDLRALIAACVDAQRRDREVYDASIRELKEELKAHRDRQAKLTNRVMWILGGLAALIFLIQFIGPTVLRELVRSWIGAGP